MIRTGGETVAPPEVEAVLGAHPDVAEVAVVGVPDAEWGEVVTAVVVVRPGADARRPSTRSGRSATAASPPFKQPRRVAVVDALPRTAATGQIQRTLIVERLQQLPPPNAANSWRSRHAWLPDPPSGADSSGRGSGSSVRGC